MKKVILVIILLLTISKFEVYAVSTLNNQNVALQYINEIRTNLNLPSYKIDSRLNILSNKHSEYMARYDILTHEQDRDSRYFIGMYPWDRAVYFKYVKPYIIEFVNKNMVSYKNYIYKILTNPYDRISILNPNFSDIGFGNSHDMFTIVIGGNKSNKEYIVKYPINNQINIKNVNIRDIDENVIKREKIKNNYIGMPVTYSYYSDDNRVEFSIKEAKIICKEDESVVPIEIITPNDDNYIYKSVVMIPEEPYKDNKEYEVKLNMTIKIDDEENKTVNERWFFSTKKISEKNDIIIDNKVNRQNFIKDLIIDLDLELDYKDMKEFTDINNYSAYAKYIYTLRKMGIISGYEDNTFRPDNFITREETMTVLMKILLFYNEDIKDKDKEKVNNENPFKDINQCSSWSKDYIELAYGLGIIRGRDNNMFNPKSILNYNEYKILINNIKKYIKK